MKNKKELNVETMTVTPSKSKKLDDLIAQLEKAHGKGSIMHGSQMPVSDVEVIPTGSLLLDGAIGIGGLPKGRIVEIYGMESSGKTTISLSVIAQAQKMGETVAFVDAEHALDVHYATKLGVNVKEMLISQPDSGEQALDILEQVILSGAVGVVVVDSVAALVPKAEIEGEMGQSHMGLQARLMSQALRKITAAANRTKTLVIFINQIRMKIGVMFGNPETTTGGNALKFYASIRLETRKGETLKDGDSIIGQNINVKVAKNKVAAPFAKVEVPLTYGVGIDSTKELYDMCVESSVLITKGGHHYFGSEKISSSRSEALEKMQDQKLKERLSLALKAAKEEARNQEEL